MTTRPLPIANSGGATASSGKIRVLFAASGWPSGMLDVASWATRAGLAEAVVTQIQPGYALALDAEDGPLFTPGTVHPELVDSFARHGIRLAADAQVRPDGTAWQIDDQALGQTYRVVPGETQLDVTILENLDDPALGQTLREWAAGRSIADRLFRPDGSLSDVVEDALLAVGRQLLAKLIAWEPHVVGFRLEGGELEQVARCIRAVRLVSEAEIVLGGPTATSHPLDVLQDLEADYVFAGEAEEPFCQFLRLAREPNSRDLAAEIPGMAYCYGGRKYHNTLPTDGYGRSGTEAELPLVGPELRQVRNRRRPVTNSEVLRANRLDWSTLEGFGRTLDSLYFTGGRGCPGACTFCAQTHGRQLRVKTAGQLLEEIESAHDLVERGTLRVTRWKLFEHVDDAQLAARQVSWAAVYDEDFFLDRHRAVRFFGLWDQSPLKHQYRLSVQTNPCSLVTPSGKIRDEMFAWIDRVKPMVQLGAESFHPDLLARWRKRHDLEQLEQVLAGLDKTRQDYTVFQLLTDFDTTPEELIETLRRLILAAFRHRRMRIASSPFTIPLYDCQTRESLDARRFLGPDRVRHFSDYERPQPGWMDPLAAELADLADAQLRFTLHRAHRDAALHAAMEAVLGRIRKVQRPSGGQGGSRGDGTQRRAELLAQAERAMDQVKDARFQAIGPGR